MNFLRMRKRKAELFSCHNIGLIKIVVKIVLTLSSSYSFSHLVKNINNKSKVKMKIFQLI